MGIQKHVFSTLERTTFSPALNFRAESFTGAAQGTRKVYGVQPFVLPPTVNSFVDLNKNLVDLLWKSASVISGAVSTYAS